MPQLVFIALIGALCVVAARALARQRAEAPVRVRNTDRSGRAIPTLVQDPVTGIYRPARRD